MIGPENLKHMITAIITRIAITYPFFYIDSVSFLIRNKLIAACFWTKQSADHNQQHVLEIGRDIYPGCYIYQSTADYKTTEVEISGRDAQGKNILVSLPLTHITSFGFSNSDNHAA